MNVLADWQPFLAVQAGAAATLTGLVFVAVSLNVRQIIEAPGLPGRALDSLLQFLQVFFISSWALVPHQTAAILAIEIFAVALLSLTAQGLSQTRYARSRAGHPVSWLLSRTVLTLLGSLPFCISTILLFRDSPAWVYWLVPGFVFSFAGAVISAWVLLVEILR